MKYQFSNDKIQYTTNANGEIEFRHNGTLYRSVGQPTFDNSPNNNYSTYSAPLVCPEDVDYPEDNVGKVEWEIIGGVDAWREIEDESGACNWDKFDIYL